MHKDSCYRSITKLLKIYTRCSNPLYLNKYNSVIPITTIVQNYSVFKYRPFTLSPFDRLAKSFLYYNQKCVNTNRFKSHCVESGSENQIYSKVNVLESIIQNTNIIVPNKHLVSKRNYANCSNNTSESASQRARIKEYKKRKSKLPPLCKACPRKGKPKKQNTFFSILWSKLGFSSTKKKFTAHKSKARKKECKKKNIVIAKPTRIAICTAEFENDVKKTDSSLTCKGNPNAMNMAKLCKEESKVCADKEDVEKECSNVNLIDKLDAVKAESQKIKLAQVVISECKQTDEQNLADECEPSIDKKMEDLCKKYNLDNIWLSDNVNTKESSNHTCSSQRNAEDCENGDVKLDVEIVKSIDKEVPCVYINKPDVDQKPSNANQCTSNLDEDTPCIDRMKPGAQDIPCIDALKLQAQDTPFTDKKKPASQDIPSVHRMKPCAKDTPLTDGMKPGAEDIPCIDRMKPDAEDIPCIDRMKPGAEDIPCIDRMKPDAQDIPCLDRLKLLAQDKTKPGSQDIPSVHRVKQCAEDKPFTDKMKPGSQDMSSVDRMKPCAQDSSLTDRMKPGAQDTPFTDRMKPGGQDIPSVDKMKPCGLDVLSIKRKNYIDQSNILKLLNNGESSATGKERAPDGNNIVDSGHQKQNRETREIAKETETNNEPGNTKNLFVPVIKKVHICRENMNVSKESNQSNEELGSKQSPKYKQYSVDIDDYKDFEEETANQPGSKNNSSTQQKSNKDSISSDLQPFKHNLQSKFYSKTTQNEYQEPFKHLTMYEMFLKSTENPEDVSSKQLLVSTFKTNNEYMESVPKDKVSNENNDTLDASSKPKVASNPLQIPYEVYNECIHNPHPTKGNDSKIQNNSAFEQDTIKLEKIVELDKIMEKQFRKRLGSNLKGKVTKPSENIKGHKDELNVAYGLLNPNTIYTSNNTQFNKPFALKYLNNQSPIYKSSKPHDQRNSQTNISLNHGNLRSITEPEPNIKSALKWDAEAKGVDYNEIMSCKFNIIQNDGLNDTKTMKDENEKRYQVRLTLSESSLDNHYDGHFKNIKNVDTNNVSIKNDTLDSQNDRTARRIVNEPKSLHDRIRNFTTSALQSNEEFQAKHDDESKLKDSITSSAHKCPYDRSSGSQEISNKGKTIVVAKEKPNKHLLKSNYANIKSITDFETDTTTDYKQNFKHYANELMSSTGDNKENKTRNNEFCEICLPHNTKETLNGIKQSRPCEPDTVRTMKELSEDYKNFLTSMLKLCQHTEQLTKMPEPNDNYKNFQDMEVKYNIENNNHKPTKEFKGTCDTKRKVSEKSSVNLNRKSTLKCSKTKTSSKIIHKVPVCKHDSAAQSKLRKQNVKSSKLPPQYVVDSTMLSKFITLIKNELVQSDSIKMYAEKCQLQDSRNRDKTVVNTRVDNVKNETPTKGNSADHEDENNKNISLDNNNAEQLHNLLSYKAHEFCKVMLELVKLFSSYKSNNELLKQENALKHIQSHQNRINNLKDTVKSIQDTIGKYFLKSGTNLNNCFNGDTMSDCRTCNLPNQIVDKADSTTFLPSMGNKYPKIDIRDLESGGVNKSNWYLHDTQTPHTHSNVVDYLFSNKRGTYENREFKNNTIKKRKHIKQ